MQYSLLKFHPENCVAMGVATEKVCSNFYKIDENKLKIVHSFITAALSGVNIGSRDQNINMGTNRHQCDSNDCQKLYDWFEIRNPFSMKDGNLYSLSSGVVPVHGKDQVNCDGTGSIGTRVQESLTDLKFHEAKIKRKNGFVALDSLTRSISKDEKNPVCVNHTLLFTRLAEKRTLSSTLTLSLPIAQNHCSRTNS